MEKGIDIDIAVNALMYAFADEYDVLLLFSQDTDFIPLVTTVKEVAKSQGRNIDIFSVFPEGNGYKIPQTQEIKLRINKLQQKLK